MSIQTTQQIEFALTSSGTFTDITPYLEIQGFEVETESLCGSKVTTLNGTEYIGKFAERNEISLTFRGLTTAELVTVENFLKQEYFYIRYVNPRDGEKKTSQVYCSNRGRNHMAQKSSSIIWGGLAVTLTERNATS